MGPDHDVVQGDGEHGDATLASVVVVNHDYERFLAAAIDSALAQTHSRVEVVVVDNDSTDGSRAVLAGYADRVTVVHAPNGGHAGGMNVGFPRTSGAIVHFLDADDRLHPDALARAVAEHERAPFAKAHWPLRVVDAAGRPTGAIDPAVPLPEGDLAARVLAHGPGALVHPPCAGNVYGRAFLERVLPVPAELWTAADGYLYELAPLFGRVARFTEPLADYRHHGASAFSATPFDRRFAGGLRMHRALVAPMAARARELGVEPDVAGWRERSWYERLARFLAELDELVAPGEPFALVEPERLGPDRTDRRRLVAVHTPADLARARDAGADLLVVGWPSFARWERLTEEPVQASPLLRAYRLGRARARGRPRPTAA